MPLRQAETEMRKKINKQAVVLFVNETTHDQTTDDSGKTFTGTISATTSSNTSSVTKLSVVIIIDAIEAAFCNALLVTFVGSTIPVDSPLLSI